MPANPLRGFAVDRAQIRRIGHGYRNFHNYRRRLLLGCGVQWTTVPTRRIRSRQPAFAA